MDMGTLLNRDEAGHATCESDTNAYGWIRLDAARQAIADYDSWAAVTPRLVNPGQVRLAVSPVLDQHTQARAVGWYIDFNDKD